MKDRIIEMLNNGERVDLVCVDRDGFIKNSVVNKKLLKHGNFTITRFSREVFDLNLSESELDLLRIGRVQAFIHVSELKYFKIKEPEYTFNDLIDVAVQAMKDGKVYFRFLSDGQISFSVGRGEDTTNILKGSDGAEEISNAIDLINSLYTETFVIESEEDIEKLCDDAEITLANNEKGIFNNCSGLRSITNLKTGFEVHGLNIFWLKGATVTQKRGDS